MKALKKYLNFLYLSLFGCFLSGVSLLFVPFVDLDGESAQKVFALFVAALFWAGLIMEIVLFLLANRQCNVIEERLVQKGSKSFRGARIGLLTFFSGPEAIFADVIAVISLIALVLLIIFKATNEWLFVIVAVIVFFSFNMHCFLNGRNYKYMKEIKKYIKKQGAKKDE